MADDNATDDPLAAPSAPNNANSNASPNSGADKQQSPPLIEEMTEGMALSMLVFLLADLRLMSATGRVRTKYETLAIDSDFLQKTSAERLACSSSQPEEGHKSNGEGLSPSQLMAIVLIEMKQAFDTTRAAERDEKEPSSSSLSTPKFRYDEFINFANTGHKKTKKPEEQMHSLLKAYAVMIGGDLNEKVPHIEARRSMYNLKTGLDTITEGNVLTAAQAQVRRGNPMRQTFLQHMKDKRESLMPRKSNRDVMKMEEVTDALFDMGKTDSALRQSIQQRDQGKPSTAMIMSKKRDSLSADELLEIMISAVESRDAEKLDFMVNFFRSETISQLMVLSKARVVWVNDWYPVNDLIYAIAVDEEKRRLTVVFRGAITLHDWSKAFDADLRMVRNPIEEDFEGKTKRIGIYSGFYQYLFRTRKDTGTNKYDEIVTMAHKYGLERIGEDYTLVVTGHSLGAALSTVFSFYASTDPRFTKNGPIKVFTFGSPYIGGHEFADCFRHQEERGKLLYARFYNHNDFVAFVPGNFAITKRGSKYRHVGIGIEIPPVPRWFTRHRKWNPKVYYVGNEGCLRSYRRGVGRNFLLRSPWRVWRIAKMHSLAELQTRVQEGRLRMADQSKYELLKLPIEELYKELA